jgi:hypothetical protein
VRAADPLATDFLAGNPLAGFLAKARFPAVRLKHTSGDRRLLIGRRQ